MPSTSSRNKSRSRPVKKAALKRRRFKVQQRRLIALGVPEKQVMQLNARQVRALLRRPAKLRKAAS